MVLEVSEIFESIQGEGKYTGTPVLFIRLSKCNLNCSWCDSKYSWGRGNIMNNQTVAEKINKSDKKIVVWTGGEVLLQIKDVLDVMSMCPDKEHHLETNATILTKDLYKFKYIAFSPKDLETAKKASQFLNVNWIDDYDFKVVTDLEEVGLEMLPYATRVMTLSTYTEKDKEIQQKVWQYAVDHNLGFDHRMQVCIFGQRRGV